MPVLASGRRMSIRRDHPLYDEPCPVCDGPLGEGVTVLVFAGIDPESRKSAGWTTGAAVAVHASCAGVPQEEPETPGTVDPPVSDSRITKALEIASEYGTIDGDHHKMWTVDQMVRALTGCPVVTKNSTDYKGVPYSYEAQGESPEYTAFIGDEEWEVGIAP
jgi:hypothetical protein